MRKIFTLKSVLTFDAFRLNNRDNLRERSTSDNSSHAAHAYQLDSVRQHQKSYDLKPKTRPTAVAITVNSTATTDFATGMHASAYDTKRESDKSVRILLIVVALRDHD